MDLRRTDEWDNFFHIRLSVTVVARWLTVHNMTPNNIAAQQQQHDQYQYIIFMGAKQLHHKTTTSLSLQLSLSLSLYLSISLQH
jgi:hypothetical protein